MKLPWSAAIVMSGWCRLYAGPGSLTALRAERHNGQGRAAGHWVARENLAMAVPVSVTSAM